MKIAIFDHLIEDSNAIGRCHRHLLASLANEHEFTVFAVAFDNPNPEKIRFVKIPALRRPLLGLMLSFHLIAPLILFWYRWVKGQQFDLVQGIGGNFLGADLAYGHFCHRVYLREHVDARPKAIVRRVYSWFYDSIVAFLEPFIYEQAKYIVTPSQGLAAELKRNYQGADAQKIHIIPNPVNLEKMRKPSGFDAALLRTELGFQADDLVLLFVAAGHFERKGLPLLLDALQSLQEPAVKLIVVGGTGAMIGEYQAIAAQKGLKEKIRFLGFQSDIRPYLWSADLFAFPSAYEVFPLVSLEAAAAGLPLLAAPLHGVEEFLVNDSNGWCVERKPAAFAEKIRFAVTHREVLKRMGEAALSSVDAYSPEAFTEKWRSLYQTIESHLAASNDYALKTIKE